jgi:hypothetical protein
MPIIAGTQATVPAPAENTAGVAIQCQFLKACQKKSFCVRMLNFLTLHTGFSFFQTPHVSGAKLAP